MYRCWHIGLIGMCAAAVSCSSSEGVGTPEETGVAQSASQEAKCGQAEPKDILIAELMRLSLNENFPLTRLYVDAEGNVTGPSLPDSILGQLELINTVPEARDSVAAALEKVSGLPDYSIDGFGFHAEACEDVPAWTPGGTVLVDTDAFWVLANETNYDSWSKTHKEFGKQCPLVKRVGNDDIVDPPGDGSTNAPPSDTVSSTGVRANAFGLCATGTAVGTYCKLSYATGVNWTGRWCQWYYGSLRCVLK